MDQNIVRIDVPAQFAGALAAEQKIFDGFVTAARRMRAAGDRGGLRMLADAMRERQEQALVTTGGWLRRVTDRVGPALADVYDDAFPPPAAATLDDLASVGDALDAPWPTPRRAALITRLAVEATSDPAHLPMFTAIADAVVDAPESPARDRAARLLIGSPLGYVDRVTVVRLLSALHARGALDADAVLRAHLADHQLGQALDAADDSDGLAGRGRPVTAAAAIRAHLDEILWRVTATGDLSVAPDGYRPHGPRFVLRGLALEAARRGDDAIPSVVTYMCRAVLTPTEVVALGDELATRPAAARRAGFAHRWAVGDSAGLLVPLDLADAGPLHDLMRAAAVDAEVDGEGRRAFRPFRCDADAVRAAIARCGAKQARELLDLAGDPTIAEEFGAVAGWNAAAVRKRFATHALVAIAAYGLLPLADGEPVADRFAVLASSAARATGFLGDRRLHHLDAVDLALDHLAQVAGYADASELRLDMEAQLGTTARTSWTTGDYTIRLDTATAELRIARAGRDLASVPSAVRRAPDYADARAAQEALREQRRRMRNGLIERLVATGAPLEGPRLALLLHTPAGAALLPGVVWRDSSGVIGLHSGGGHLIDARGERHPLEGPVTAVHPVALTSVELARWQAEVVRRRVVQPVKQLFREVYVPTPAELAAGVESARFAGHVVAGNVAAALLSDRGWHVDHAATGPTPIVRRIGDVDACVRADHRDRLGQSEVTLETVHFSRDGARLRVDAVPDIVFSEVMRDLALVVGVAGRRVDATAAGLYDRAALLGALIAGLDLDRVTVEGHTALVHGRRADYRVHLGSGTVYASTGGYLSDVPPREVFLPYAEDDPLTRTVLGKVLTLADDVTITDPGVLSQLARFAGAAAA